MVVKTLTKILALLAVLFLPLLALAQAEPASLPSELTTAQALAQLLQALGGLKSATVLGIVGLVIQAGLLFFRTQLANFAGKWKLVIVTGLSLVGGVVTLVSLGTPWLAALSSSATLASLQVFGNQLWKQLSEKNPTPPGAEH